MLPATSTESCVATVPLPLLPPFSLPIPAGSNSSGAFFVPQHLASWTFRFGSQFGIDYTPQTNPVIGQAFNVDVNADPIHVATAVLIYSLPASPIPTPFGELLIDLGSTQVFVDVATPVGGVSSSTVVVHSRM